MTRKSSLNEMIDYITSVDSERDLLYNASEFIKSHNEIKLTSSSGSSYVFITEKEKVYQVFIKYFIAQRIFNIVKTLYSESYNINFLVTGGYPIISVPFSFNIGNYIVKFQNYISRLNIIIWEKITPLNSMNFTELKVLLERNWIKFLWDIGLALHGLHSRMLLHNDSVLDNIGISPEGNFILFDFDGTRFMPQRTFQKDFVLLADSIENKENLISEQQRKLLTTWTLGSSGAKAVFNSEFSYRMTTRNKRPSLKERTIICKQILQELCNNKIIGI